MTVTVQDVMRQMRNYFIASTLTGTFTVADGIIDLDPPLAPGAWVAIEGSSSLDGVHQLDENGKLPDAADGSWRGLLHLLSPTADFLRHFLNRLLHYRQLRMNQSSQSCARHAA